MRILLQFKGAGIELIVDAVLLDQILVVAPLHDAAVIQQHGIYYQLYTGAFALE